MKASSTTGVTSALCFLHIVRYQLPPSPSIWSASSTTTGAPSGIPSGGIGRWEWIQYDWISWRLVESPVLRWNWGQSLQLNSGSPFSRVPCVMRWIMDWWIGEEFWAYDVLHLCERDSSQDFTYIMWTISVISLTEGAWYISWLCSGISEYCSPYLTKGHDRSVNSVRSICARWSLWEAFI